MPRHLPRSGPRNPDRRPPRRGVPQRGKPSLWPKIAVLAGIAVTVLGGGGFAAHNYMSQERPDQFGCYARPGQAEVAVWLDASLVHQSATQIRDYERGFEQAYDQAPANARVMIFSTARNSAGTLIEPVFTICKPAASEVEQDAPGIPSKTAPMLVREAMEARSHYLAAMEEAVSTAQNPALQAGDSPILEQLRSLSWHAQFQGRNRSLTVITDGIQNSEIARFCTVQGDMPSFDTFSRGQSYVDVKPEAFVGTAVSVLLIESFQLPAATLPYCSNAELRAWWRDYFDSNGAAPVRVTAVRRW